MRLFDNLLRGLTVIAADGLAIGEVAFLVINSDDWRVESLQVKLRSDIADRVGADRGVFHAGSVEISTRWVQSVGDAVLLSVAVDALQQPLPGADMPAPTE